MSSLLLIPIIFEPLKHTTVKGRACSKRASQWAIIIITDLWILANIWAIFLNRFEIWLVCLVHCPAIWIYAIREVVKSPEPYVYMDNPFFLPQREASGSPTYDINILTNESFNLECRESSHVAWSLCISHKIIRSLVFYPLHPPPYSWDMFSCLKLAPSFPVTFSRWPMMEAYIP